MVLNIHTVFKLRENILFLEEWIAYHLSIGFDKIYLYDNSKSIGIDGSSTDINKYGYNFKQITRHLSDTDIETMLFTLLEKYNKEIVYIKWEPKDLKGNIVYGQKESIIDYITNHGKEDGWTAFIDIDEFIFSKKGLREFLDECNSAGIGDILLLQKKFDDRFNNLGKPVTHIVGCIEGIDTTGWAPKHILKNSCFNLAVPHWGIHSLPVRECRSLQADIKMLRFNHYNINAYQLKWMRSFYGTDVEFKLNAECRELYDQYYNIEFL